MPTTTPAQLSNHTINISAAEGERQRAYAAARQAYNNTPAAYPIFDMAIQAADIAYCDAIILSAGNNGFAGPTKTRAELTKSRSI